jgi:hypothetical protein
MSLIGVKETHNKIYLYMKIDKYLIYFIDNKDDALAFARATRLVD